MLLQKQDDKMVLKCHSKSTIAVQEGKQMLSPIIKLDSVFLREVATGQPLAVERAPLVSSPGGSSFCSPDRSKGLLRDLHLGQRRSDLRAGGSVRRREENVGVERSVRACGASGALQGL